MGLHLAATWSGVITSHGERKIPMTNKQTVLISSQRLIRHMASLVAGSQATPDDLDDYVSQVNLVLLDGKLEAYQEGRGMSLSSFIGMVAKTTTIDALRRKCSRGGQKGLEERVPMEMLGEADDARDNAKDQNTDVLSALIKREQATRVREAIALLPPMEREVIDALSSDDFTVAGYCAAHNMTATAFYTLKCRGVKRLKDILKGGPIK